MARILILEDQLELAETWRSVLIEHGHRVVLVSDYAEFETAFRSGEQVELMIIDLSLAEDKDDPKYSGLIALSDNLLRVNIRGEKIPCIVVSGHFSKNEADQDPLRKRVLPFQPDRILAKPFAIKDLLSTVSDLVGTAS